VTVTKCNKVCGSLAKNTTGQFFMQFWFN